MGARGGGGGYLAKAVASTVAKRVILLRTIDWVEEHRRLRALSHSLDFDYFEEKHFILSVVCRCRRLRLRRRRVICFVRTVAVSAVA